MFGSTIGCCSRGDFRLSEEWLRAASIWAGVRNLCGTACCGVCEWAGAGAGGRVTYECLSDASSGIALYVLLTRAAPLAGGLGALDDSCPRTREVCCAWLYCDHCVLFEGSLAVLGRCSMRASAHIILSIASFKSCVSLGSCTSRVLLGLTLVYVLL